MSRKVGGDLTQVPTVAALLADASVQVQGQREKDLLEGPK